MKELKKRRIIKSKNILLFDKGYFSYSNYNIGINRYQSICIIFPTSKFNIKKLEEKIFYPLDVFKKKRIKEEKHCIVFPSTYATFNQRDQLHKKTLKPLKNWLKWIYNIYTNFRDIDKF